MSKFGPFFDENWRFFQILSIYSRFFLSKVVNCVDTCSYTLSVSQKRVKITKIQLMTIQFNQICPKNVAIFSKNGLTDFLKIEIKKNSSRTP